MLHSFADSLAASNSYSDAPWWLEVYRRAFPNLLTAVPIKPDGWAQRAGIDRVLQLACGRTYTVDEKVRTKDWPDFLLERWSDERRRVEGWIQKPLACDFLAYAFIPSSTCYLFPIAALQRAWRLHKREWVRQYGERRAENEQNGRRWTTLSTPVPRQVLLSAVAEAMVLRWRPE